MEQKVWVFLIVLAYVLPTPVANAQVRTAMPVLKGTKGVDYDPYSIIVKLKTTTSPESRAAGSPTQNSIGQLKKIPGIVKVERALRTNKNNSPNRYRSARSTRSQRVDIENIYRLRIQEEQDLAKIIRNLSAQEYVAYAEPYYLLKPLEYEPNDPQAARSGGSQTYLSAVNAYEAWAIEKGDTNIVIGILDTGIEFGHQDLSDNLKRNYKDPINGVDDDGDGYVDNFSGWDFSDNDNEPIADQNNHGIQVAGISSATTDNALGMAGIGFNSSYMPIKIFRSADGIFSRGYEAIAYAADMGCQVINLSWGGANAYSEFGQDMINYAVLERDAVVVAAAGNSGQFEDYYPASFDNVLSVAQSDDNGNKVGATTTSYFVDMVAPGVGIRSTTNNDSYRSGNGSSFAAPMVAGAAALVRAHYPLLSARQVMEQLRLSSKNIENQSANANTQGTFGAGLLDVAKALTTLDKPALRMTAYNYRNHVGKYAFYGDTLALSTEVTNFLSSATNVKVTLTSPSEYVSMIDSVYTVGALDSLATATNASGPFRMYLKENMPIREQLYFKLAFEADGYTDYQYFFLVSSPAYSDLNNSSIHMDLDSEGQIGKGSQRDGIVFGMDTLARHLGFMVAVGKDSVSDNIINNFGSGAYSNDFNSFQSVRYDRSNAFDKTLASTFDDSGADNPLALRIEQKWLIDTVGLSNDFIVSEYRIINRGQDVLTNLYPALFADWDIGDQNQNRAAWDAANALAYSYNGTLYTGMALLGNSVARHYAIDKADQNGNIADFALELSDSVKYALIATEPTKNEAGTLGSGNDVAQFLGTQLDTLAPDQHYTVAMAWVFGNSLADLQQQLNLAKGKYEAHRQNPLLNNTIFACIDSIATVNPAVPGSFRFYQDALGTVLLAEDSLYTTGQIVGDTVLYLAKLTDGYEEPIQRVDIKILEPEAAYRYISVEKGSLENDTLYLNFEDAATLSLEDLSTDAVAWQWDFGNGFESKLQNPSVAYSEEGMYTLSLKVTSAAGCTNELFRTLTVVRKAPPPLLDNLLICQNEAATISAFNSDQIRIYSDSMLNELVYEGSQFVTGSLSHDTTFYVVNAATTYQSIAMPVAVKVVQPDLQIAYRVALSGTDKYLLRLWALPTDDSFVGGKYQWRIEDTSIGSGDTIVYDYSIEHQSKRNFTVFLSFDNTVSGLTCSQSVSQLIRLNTSPDPAFEDLRVCRGDAVELAPTNGQSFYFYEDPSLSEPIHMGSSLRVDDVQGALTFYVTNMDSLLESEPTQIEVELNSFADFSISSDTLFLQENQKVVFEAYTLNSEIQNVSWKWDLGDGILLNREARVTQVYDSIGEYQIRMEAQTNDGCTNTISKTLVVKNITSVEQALDDQNLMIYPNPSSGQFLLANSRWDYKKVRLDLYNTEGKAVTHKTILYDNLPVSIDLHHLAGKRLNSGLYLLKLVVEGRVFSRRLMLKNQH